MFQVQYAMLQKLPYRGFKWLLNDEIQKLDVLNFDSDGDIGLILEVDLIVPEHIHDFTSDYPLAPEKLNIKEEHLSVISKKFLTNHGVKHIESEKLAPNLFNKSKYIVHLKNLQFYLQNGLILTNIHRVLMFKSKKHG